MGTGNERPLTVKSALLTLTDETITVAPEAISCAVCCAVCPTTTLPKGRLVGFTASCPDGVPVPDNGIFSVGLDPSDVMATLPLSLPAEVGANTTLKVMLCPEVSVSGGVIPFMLKPLPVAAA